MIFFVTSQKLMVKRLNLTADGTAGLPEHIEKLLFLDLSGKITQSEMGNQDEKNSGGR